MVMGRKKLEKWLLVAMVGMLACGSAGAEIVRVGESYDIKTIQEGIVAAGTGDTVLVEPGTYQEDIDFLGKAITVRGDGGGGYRWGRVRRFGGQR